MNSDLQAKSSKIALMWSNARPYETAQMVIQKHHLECHCELTSFQNLGEAAAISVANGAKVIVCRGDGARRTIQERVSVPVVSVKYSFSDFASAIEQARQYGNRIAMIAFAQEMFDSAKRETFFWQTETTLLHVHDIDTARREIKKLKENGIDAVIGGSMTQTIAREFNIPCILTQANENSILEAIEDAIHSLRVMEEQELRYKTVSMVVESASHGMITVDKDGIITNANQAAHRLLYATKQILGSHYTDSIPFSEIIDKTLSGQYFNNYLFAFRDSHLVINSAPIMLENVSYGVVVNIQGAEEVQSLENKLRRRASIAQSAKYHFYDIIGDSASLCQAKEHAQLYADVDSTVMICGDSGTGKELFAQSIHNASRRRNAPFVAVNCAAFPESLLESELFGYVKGAFTGASSEGRAGIFEQAHKGTIFLDEIGEMPLPLQSRLLRVLQEREVTRIGSRTVIPVDIRVITATNRDLFAEVQKGNFRQDLYYRLSILVLHLPPLRDRKADIPALVHRFIHTFNAKHSRNIDGISPAALDLLMTHDYYGNVRELSNIVERMLVLARDTTISVADVQSALSKQPSAPVSIAPAPSNTDIISDALYVAERQRIIAALTECERNQAKAAEMLGISRTTLWRKIKKLGINF